MATATKPEVVYGDKTYVDCVIYVPDPANNGDWKFTLSKDLETGEFYRNEEFGEKEECFDDTSRSVPEDIEAAYKAVEADARAAIETYIAAQTQAALAKAA